MTHHDHPGPAAAATNAITSTGAKPAPHAHTGATAPAGPRPRTARLVLAGLTGLVGLGLGAAAGWNGHAAWQAKQQAAQTAAAEAAARAAGRDPSVPDHVRDAAIAHALFLAEPVPASPIAQAGSTSAPPPATPSAAAPVDPLIPWLSRHLGAALQAPSLRDYGWKLLGGRLLPAGDDPRPGTPLARAQLVYGNDTGERLTLYISPGAGPSPAPTAIRLARRTDAGQTTLSLYWASGPLAYALSGNIDEKRLRGLADLAQARVGMVERPSQGQ